MFEPERTSFDLRFTMKASFRSVLFFLGPPDFSGRCFPNIKTSKEGTDCHHDKNRYITSYLVINETGKPRSESPSRSYEDHERSKDASIGPSFKKIRRDEGRKGGGHSVSHTEKDGIKVCEIPGRKEIE
jgi:hypothetical protein